MLEEKKSTHKVEIVPVKLEPHPNADTLSIVKVWNYQVVVKTEEWKDKEIGAYIVPDSVAPNTPEWDFLKESKRIKVRKFRGIMSQGLLVQAPEGSKLGDDVSEILGIIRYEPPEIFATGGLAELDPTGFRPKYDIEAWHKYFNLIIPGEEVIVTEKIHGANGRFTYQNNRMYCGSRRLWWKKDDKNVWWKCLEQNPWIEDFCEAYPDFTLYGEVWGNVQELKYNTKEGEHNFSIFDIWNQKEAKWLSWEEIHSLPPGDLLVITAINRWVPVLFTGMYLPKDIEKFSTGQTTINEATHIREGIVIQPVNEREDPEIGRVKLKIVNNEYLEKAK